ncbi:cytochrome p450 [Favolaschia claudopus]|uniref:Cytochrome p450 n=1 Tax=Favolaschia claudopus TaxID=2862362 RepID=A0AAV9ZG16_9AGAR
MSLLSVPMDIPFCYTACISLAVLSYCCYHFSSSASERLPLPPGPKKLPIFGNIFDLALDSPWKSYANWSKQYASDIIHLDLAGTSVIILSSVQAIEDLLEKRSSIYSDRADFPMIVDLMGWGFNIGFVSLSISPSRDPPELICLFTLALMKYGERWRTSRRLFNQAFNVTASHQFWPQELMAARMLLQRLLESPDDFFSHIRQMAAEIIMSATYGIEVQPQNDPYVATAEQALHTLAVAAVPGRYLVDVFPILKYVPSWFPGAGFRRSAEIWKQLALATVETPFAETKRRMLGTETSSFVADGLRSLNGSTPSDIHFTEQNLKETAGTMFAAGSDTTVSAVATFFLAMLSNPQAQRKAQSEIDALTGGKYLPTFQDQDSLPYVAAVVKEILRWENVTPIALPHHLIHDDEYRGYRLPKGSLVIGNSWAILHDEEMYPDPFSFKPERFLLNDSTKSSAKSPDIAFGYGRRRCPGRHMAASSVFITVASILATFDIEKATDADGTVIEPRHEYVSGLVSMPLPFRCKITPRSEAAVKLIREG